MSRFNRRLAVACLIYAGVMLAAGLLLQQWHRPQPDLTLCPFCHQ